MKNLTDCCYQIVEAQSLGSRSHRENLHFIGCAVYRLPSSPIAWFIYLELVSHLHLFHRFLYFNTFINLTTPPGDNKSIHTLARSRSSLDIELTAPGSLSQPFYSPFLQHHLFPLYYEECQLRPIRGYTLLRHGF